MFDDKFFTFIAKEWTNRVSDHKPDRTDEGHLLILREILEENNIPNNAIDEWMNNLRYLDKSKTQVTSSNNFTYMDLPHYKVTKSVIPDENPVNDEEDNFDDAEDEEKIDEMVVRYMFNSENEKIKEHDKIDVNKLDLNNLTEKIIKEEKFYELCCGMLVRQDDITKIKDKQK